MATSKTNKLKCIVTGRQLIATKDYYARKVEKAGSEEELHRTYVCREAKNLIKQGISIEKVRNVLNVPADYNHDIPEDVIQEIISDAHSTRLRRVNNIVNTSQMITTTTDPEVKRYINSIINE